MVNFLFNFARQKVFYLKVLFLCVKIWQEKDYFKVKRQNQINSIKTFTCISNIFKRKKTNDLGNELKVKLSKPILVLNELKMCIYITPIGSAQCEKP